MSVFMIILLVGIALPVVSLVAMGVFDSIHAMLHLDFGGGHASSDIGAGSAHFSFIPGSPIVWFSLLIGLGASGAILESVTQLPLWAIWPISVAIGYGLMLLVDNVFFKPLVRASVVVRKTNDIIGTFAEVNDTILENGTGSVLVKKGMTVYAAKSIDGDRLDQGLEVVIVDFEDDKALVKRWI